MRCQKNAEGLNDYPFGFASKPASHTITGMFRPTRQIFKTLFLILPVTAFSITIGRAGMPVQAAFDGTNSQFTWPLAELNPQLPSNWTPFNFLVLEFKTSSSQRFDLGLDTPAGTYHKRIGPFPEVWTRAAIPLRFYSRPAGGGVDLAATFNQPHDSYWINIDGGGYGPLTNITGLTISMKNPIGAPVLEIRSVTLTTTNLGDDILEGKPLVDEFGQYTHADWPGKAHSLDDLERAWSAEDSALQSALPTNEDEYGGFLNTRARATGFFRVEKIHGRWWFVDPDGHLFWSLGVNGVGTAAPTHVRGREDYFAALPPATSRFGVSFYTWNLERRYGDDWEGKWADLTTRRMKAWGLNTMHNWGATNSTEPRVPYAFMIRGWQTENSIMGLPDVYAADFARRIDAVAARQLEPHKDDPYMLGYFIGNEPSWPGRETLLCDAILAGPADAMQGRLKTFLAGGDTPARRKQFVLAAFKVYVDTINAATRRHDSNHLDLGIRFGGSPDNGALKMGGGFDVFSVNIYSYAPTQKKLNEIYSLVHKPILIGEFHIGTPDRGMAEGLVPAMNQAERAAGYRYYVEQCAANPAVVGAHWFQWLDEPVTGRNDGENYNIGFVDVTDQPYPEMVAAAMLTHDRLPGIHSGTIPPTDRKARVSESPATE